MKVLFFENRCGVWVVVELFVDTFRHHGNLAPSLNLPFRPILYVRVPAAFLQRSLDGTIGGKLWKFKTASSVKT
ncbi:MAG: hypothetical protein NTV31_13440 [Bacteroidia bacterium]|nr:hypothetical protein [Bacteroidia bacterium]